MRLTNKADPHPLSLRAVKLPKPKSTPAGVHVTGGPRCRRGIRRSFTAALGIAAVISFASALAFGGGLALIAPSTRADVNTIDNREADATTTTHGAVMAQAADTPASAARAPAIAPASATHAAATTTASATYPSASEPASSPPAAALPPGVRPLSPCQLEHPQKLTVVAAECGELTVPENAAKPAGRQIRLAFARVPAISRRKHPDPLFILAGGPGMAATTFYAMVAPVFARIHRDRDIILLDQRGTGASNPLNCDGGDETDYHPDDTGIAAEARACLQKLSVKADVAQYTTSVAVNDLDRLRELLGYEHINLYGVSYGTRVAQQYLRRFSQHTRTLLLDGVVPPQLSLGASMAFDAEHSLERILARCAREKECRSQFGDPQRDYHDLWQALQTHGVAVSVTDPTTGKPTRFEFTRFHLATVLRLSIYSAEPTALLPLLLHETHESNDFSSLAVQFLLLTRAYTDVVAVGMNNTVACTEDLAFYDPKTTDRSKLENTFLGTAQLDGLLTVCGIWPRGPIDSDFHAPLHSDVPALLLSGSDDPVTPPAYAEQARHGLTNSLHIVLQDFGHGQLAAACMDRVMEQFVNRASVAGLDVSCTRNDKPMPFFTSLNGPPP
jgi:pimeloyl-ACP methyl ester carboxylesterase